jgi:opacity protein-like surface antigen
MKPVVAGTFAMMLLARVVSAQGLYAGVRAGVGIPTGEFSESRTTKDTNAFLRGASPGLGYGLDAGFGAGPIGFYASYDKIQFDCRSESCASAGKYDLTGYAAGVRASVPLLALLKPWAKAGITYNEMNGTVGSGTTAVSVKTGKSPGYEMGAGVDIPVLAGFFSLTPQVRYVRQRLNPNDAGKRDVNYYTFDIGFRVRTPL